MAKYKVGDVVYIPDNLEAGKKYSGINFTPYMMEYKGKYLTIKEVTKKGNYILKEDSNNYYWSEGMFSDINTKENKKENKKEVNNMRDIFDILRHELKVVRNGSEYLIGCVGCGITLYSISKDNKDINKDKAEEIVKLYDLFKREKCVNLESNFVKLLEEAIGINYKFISDLVKNELKRIYDTNNIETNVYITNEVKDAIKKVLLDEYGFERSRGIVNILDIDKYSNMYLEVLEVEYDDSKYTLVKQDESGGIKYTISNITSNCHSSTLVITLLNNSLVETSELETPTAKDVYVIKDWQDYCKIKPNWEDAESGNNKYNEYIYRMNNDLYDLSNINLLKILEETVESFEGYDYVEDTIAATNKVIREMKKRQ